MSLSQNQVKNPKDYLMDRGPHQQGRAMFAESIPYLTPLFRHELMLDKKVNEKKSEARVLAN